MARIGKNKIWHALETLNDRNGIASDSTIETLKILANEHYPIPRNKPKIIKPDISKNDPEVINKILSNSIISKALKSLKPKKAPGIDEIRNEMIKASWDHIGKNIIHVFKECLTFSYCPDAWKISKAVILAKPGKDDYQNPKSFRIISLTSNIQKLLEKCILIYLEECIKIDKQLTKNQFGFRKQK